MKRQKPSKPFHRNRIVLNDIAFDFISTQHLVVSGETVQGKVHYKFRFNNPLVQNTYFKTTHLPSQRSDICINLTSEESAHVEENDFIVYETHSLSLDKKCMYIALENMNLCGRDDQENVHIYRPVFDLGLAYFDDTRYTRLKYIAPDCIEGIDASIIPQSVPLWSKKGGAITSSSVQRYLGYFVPNPYDLIYDCNNKVVDKRETEWTLKTKTNFVGWLAARVRFGSMKEDDMIVTILEHYPDFKFAKTGYHVHPDHPTKWGASPDGILVDKDNIKYTIEFKASTFDNKFKGYHIPQVIWEVKCADASHGLLVKYCEKRRNSNDLPEITCRVAQIDLDTIEDEIVELVTAAKEVERSGNSLEYKKLMHTPKYIDMRKRLDDMADALDYTDLDVPRDEIDKMYAYMRSVYQAELPPNMHGHPVMNAIEMRQFEIHNMINDSQGGVDNKRQKMTNLIFEQIRDYTKLV